MGSVQQAVLEFDEEVRAPWRPRLVPDTGGEPPVVRHPSRHAPSRVGAYAAPARRRVDPRAGNGVPLRAPAVAAFPDAGVRPPRDRVGAPARRRRARLRLTRRARRLAWVVAMALGVLLGSWLGPMLSGEGELRLAGDSSVVVQQGDSLWSIASAVAGAGEDVRAVVHELRQVNGLRDSRLEPGQVLRLP